MNETVKSTAVAQLNSPYELRLEISHFQPTSCHIAIVVPEQFVDIVYQQAILAQQKTAEAPGFQKGCVPLAYIERNFTSNIIEHLKEFLFKFCVSNFLFRSLREHKLLVAGLPRLSNIDVEPHKDGRFHFELSLFPKLESQEWKYLPFKPPKRKNYRDLDRQVEGFIKDERDVTKEQKDTAIAVHDWVYFSVTLADKQGNPLLGDHREYFWFKVGNEEADKEFHELFLGRKLGESFVSEHHSLQQYFSSQPNTTYTFLVTIHEVLFDKVFCFDAFKRHFRIKTNKEMHRKIIEVHSFNKDLSQRRDMVEAAFELLFLRNKFDVPGHMVLRQQKDVIATVQNNPDYYVYRMQPDFKERIRQLAEKQAKETIFIDQVAYQESVQIIDQDVKGYLNLTKRPRMRDFLHFELPETKLRGQELPISAEEVKNVCLKEKTLNYILYHLTKK